MGEDALDGDRTPAPRVHEVWTQIKVDGGVKCAKDKIRQYVQDYYKASRAEGWLLALRSEELPVTELWALELERARPDLTSMDALAALAGEHPEAMSKQVDRLWTDLTLGGRRPRWQEWQLTAAIRHACELTGRSASAPVDAVAPVPRPQSKGLAAKARARSSQSQSQSQATQS